MGTVVDQGPPAGEMVPLLTPVDIVLAQGVAVPDLMGSPMNEARRQVEGIGLVVASITQQISTADPGTVLGQTPDPGVMVPLETGVNLVVAQGVLVPDLFGQDTAGAAAHLGQEGLALGEVALEPSAETPGTVIRQSPPAGDPVGLETPVDVVLAEPVPVPAVVDSIQDVAEHSVTTQGLLFVVDRNRWSFAPTGTVLQQLPEPGTLVPLETPVVVVLARHVPGGWGLPGALLLGIFLVGAIRVRSGKKKDDEERPPPADQPDPGDTRPPGDRPLVEVRAHTHPGKQSFESDQPPTHTAEIQWRVVVDPGRIDVETADSLIQEERSAREHPPEGDDDA
jgi:beta-lactam-binding protein with PASTA domain